MNYCTPVQNKNIQLKLILCTVFSLFSFIASAQYEEYCAACSWQAWEGDSAAINNFIASCGIIDTVAFDSTGSINYEKPSFKVITMKLHSGREVYKDSIYFVADKKPEYPGGDIALLQYLSNNIIYPEAAKEKKISGRVYVNFIVQRDGSASHVKIIRGIGGGCDEEAIRVIKNLQGWKPGIKNGKPVRVFMNIPVKFSMS